VTFSAQSDSVLALESVTASLGEATVMADAARLRLDCCKLEQLAGARSRVTVRFVSGHAATSEGEGRFAATHEGSTCPGGDLRLAALATFDALAQATGHALTFELIGVKPVRAFDATVIMVAAVVRVAGAGTKVIGAAVDEGEPITTAARAALQAVNRLVAPHLSAGPSRHPR
jgi:hypothetical protein